MFAMIFGLGSKQIKRAIYYGPYLAYGISLYKNLTSNLNFGPRMHAYFIN